MTSLSRRAPRRAWSLIRRTFRSSGVTPDLCHMQWHGPSCSALPPDEARSCWRAHFSSPTGDSPLSDDFFHTLSLFALRLLPLCMLPSLTTNSLRHSPSATSLHQARTASHTHSSKSLPLVASSSVFLLCASLWFRPLGSPVTSSRSSSAMVTLLLLTLTAPFLSHPSLSKFSSTLFMLALPATFFHNSTLPRAVSTGVPTLWPFSLVDSSRLRRHMHTFVAFIDIKKAFDSCWVEATLVRLFDFRVTGRLWHLLATFLCGTLSQVRLGGSVSSPWVDSGIAQGRILSPLLFNLLIDSLAVHLRSAIPGVSLTTSDSFPHACQLHADDLVILTASQTDLQLALLGCSLALPPWSSVLCAAALTAVFTSVAFPCPWFSSAGIWALSFPPLSLGALILTFCVPARIVFFTRPVPGVLVKVPPLSFSSSVFVTYVLSSSSFGLEFIADDPPALQQFNLALRRWCRHLLGWPRMAQRFSCCCSTLGTWHR